MFRISFAIIGFLLLTNLSYSQSKIAWVSNGSGTVKSSFEDGTSPTTLVTGASSPDGMVFANGAGKIFWVEGGSSKLRSANFDGTNVQDIATFSTISPRGVTINESAGKLYIIGTSGFAICNLDGSSQVINTTSAVKGRQIFYNPVNNLLYFTDQGANLYSSNVTGTTVTTLKTGLTKSWGVKVNISTQKLFYADNNGVYTCNLDGSNTVTIVSFGTSSIYTAIGVDERNNYLFYSQSSSIKRAALDGSSSQTIIASVISCFDITPLNGSTLQASNVLFSNTTSGSTKIDWTNGNGTGRAVFISAASSGTADPINGTAYTANTVFGSGTQIGTTGWYCVYNGTGSTVNVSGLTSGTTYRVMVCDYTGSGATSDYNVSPGTLNPQNVTTTSAVKYVTPTGAGTGDGSSWANALSATNFPTSLAAAVSGDQFWVSAGTYNPTTGTDRSKTFTLPSGVQLYGGFTGTETQLNQRNFKLNNTILSGDIGTQGLNTDNSYIIVTITNASNTTRLDGFTITGAYNTNSIYGGGILNTITASNSSSPTITNCVITQNSNTHSPTSFGGGIANYIASGTSNPVVTNCFFSQNSTGYWGGAVDEEGANSTYYNCVFVNNFAVDYGGAFRVGVGSTTTMANCSFYNNYITSSSGDGGGLRVAIGTPNLNAVNLLFANNSFNTTNNTAAGCDISNESTGTVSITYSLTQNYAGSTNIVNSNPNFVNTSNLIGADNIWGTADDGLQLQSSSAAKDAGTATGAPATDITGTARPQGSGYDIGAYELISIASNALDKLGLSNTSPSSGAYSIRQLSTSYTGKLFQVRRSSDNTTQDVGFTAGGEADTTALKTFVGSGDGFVSIWYDQSGSGNNATQATALLQPRIVSAGVIERLNNRLAINFKGTQYLTVPSAVIVTGSNPSTLNAVAKLNNNTGWEWVVNYGSANEGRAIGSTSSNQVDISQFSAHDSQGVSSTSQFVAVANYTSTVDTLNSQVINPRGGNSTVTLTRALNTGNTAATIGNKVDNSQFWDGYIQEVTLFSSNLLGDKRQSIQDSQLLYYGLPTISATGTLTALSTTQGTASSTTSFSVSGTSMLEGILVTPPAGFEVSTSASGPFTSTITVGSAGNITATTVYVRLASTDAAGTYSGNIVLSSSAATSVNVAAASSSVNVAPTLTTTTGSGKLTIGSSGGAVIDAGITINSLDPNSLINNGLVYISSNLKSTEDVILYPAAKYGVTASYNSATGVLLLSGSATVAQYQEIFRTIEYQNTNASATVSDRTFTFSLGNALPFTPCGASTAHYYEFIANSGITWTAAKAAAEARTYFGLQGYMTTITCAEENNFAFKSIAKKGWIGASDAAVEGEWRWVTGPEAGTLFFSGQYPTGTAVGGLYNNWDATSEPNNSGNEDYAHFITTGKWNDYANTTPVDGYYVEYGGMSGDPVIAISASKVVKIVTAVPTLTTSAGTVARISGNTTAVVIDPNVTVNSITAGATLDNGLVYINSGFVSSEDKIIYPANLYGVTATYTAATGVLQLSGTATMAQYQEIFRTIQYQNTNTGAAAGSRSFTFALGNALPFIPCGATSSHYYEFVPNTGITWTAAKTAAEARTYFGLQGYLTTLTCAEENNFAFKSIAKKGWIGASDAALEGDWYWLTGPETGTLFYKGQSPTGAAVGGLYNNWDSGEPNNSGSENYAHFTATGKWNDYANTTTVDGYYVEYGGMSGDPSVTISGVKALTITLAAPTAAAVQAVCGSGTVADLVATPPTGSSVRWYTVPTAGTVLTSTTSLVTATTYYAESWNGSSASPTRTAVVLTINVIPAKPVLVPTSTAKIKVKLCPGDNIVCSNFDNTLTYQWKLNGTNLTGQTSNQYKVPVGGTGVYSLYVKNPTTGCDNLSATVTVDLYSITTPVIYEKKKSDYISILIVDNTSKFYTNYSWSYADGSALPSGIVTDRQFLVLPPANMAATYMVNITDTNACKVTSAVKTVALHTIAAKAYPTMNNGNFMVGLTDAQDGKLNVKIFNQNGILQKVYAFDNVSSEFEYQVNAAGLQAGAYTVEISLGDYVQSQKIIIR
jgi:Ig-like domain CHU_C associated